MITKDNWTHYLYSVTFADGCYYTGVSKRRNNEPLTDGYYGSPVSNRDKWQTETPTKRVVAFIYADDCYDAFKIESQWQRLNFDLNDPKCLNAHFGNVYFDRASAQKGGSITGKINAQNGHLDRIRLKSNQARRRPVIVIDALGEDTRFESIREAAKALNKHHSTLCNILSNRRSQCQSFSIRYA